MSKYTLFYGILQCSGISDIVLFFVILKLICVTLLIIKHDIKHPSQSTGL